MKIPNGGSPWEWWQPLRLRMEARKRMRPMTPDTANRRRVILSALYCASAFLLFHVTLFRAGAFSHKPDGINIALDQMNEGKIVNLRNFRIVKVTDFDSADFDDRIPRSNKGPKILE